MVTRDGEHWMKLIFFWLDMIRYDYIDNSLWGTCLWTVYWALLCVANLLGTMITHPSSTTHLISAVAE